MRRSVIASSFLVGAVALALTATSHGVVVSANLPTVNAQGMATGQFSDCYLSNGTYFNGQTIATPFSTSQAYNLTQLTWWGFSENFFQAGLENIAGFQVRILDSTQTNVLVNQVWMLPQLAIQATGNLGTTGGIEYQFAGALNHFLASGSYWLNIGFIAVDGSEDGWLWSDGMNPPGPLGAAYSIGAFQGDAGWSAWNNELQGGMSHILFGQAVPGPGALSLLVVGGLMTRRRRRLGS